MKTTLFLAVSLLLSSTCWAQNKDFNLSNYKTPNYVRHELTTSFDLAGNQNSYSLNEYSNPASSNNTDYRTSQFMTNLNLEYLYTYNTRKSTRQLSVELNPNYAHTVEKIDQDKNKTTLASLQFQINGHENYYLTEDKFFLHIAPFLSYSPRIDKSDSPNQEFTVKTSGITAELEAGIGYGRIEPVSDLWQSYYILQSLEAHGLFSRELTQEDIYDFARTATLLKNKRFFDSRLRKIAELKTLDSLLQEKVLITDNSISYFTIINDYWSFATIADRNAGRKVLLAIRPVYNQTAYKYEDDPKETTDQTRIVSSITYNYQKPINLYWDQILRVSIFDQIQLSDEDYDYPPPFV